MLQALPPDSELQRALNGHDPTEEVWTLERELLAQLVELTSITATGGRRVVKDVVRVPRPRQRGSRDLAAAARAIVGLGARIRGGGGT